MKNKILFILATHGDESFSIDVLKKIESNYPKAVYGYDWVIGNEKALKEKVRFIKTDLNRSAPGRDDSSSYEEKRVAELIRLANKYKYVIDIHGTISNTGIFTIIPKPDIKNILFSAILPIKRNVFWYSKRSLDKGPIVQFCKPSALEIECGPKSSPKIARELEKVIIYLLINMQRQEYETLFSLLSNKEFYAVYGSQNVFNKGIRDFKSVNLNGEQFYPLLINQYRSISYYKMRKISFQDLFLY